MKKAFFLLAVIAFSFSNLPAYSIENGEVALGGPVVGIFFKNTRVIFCSGAMVAPRIVATAHHCLPTAGDEINLVSNFPIQVSSPGSVINDEKTQAANVVDIVSNKFGWKIGDCAQGYCEDLDDVLFLVIDQDFKIPENFRIATKEEIEKFRLSKSSVETYGYGKTKYLGKVQNTPQKLKAYLDSPNKGGFGDLAFNVVVSGNQNICGGDSGGPSYVTENGYIYYLGPTSVTRRPSCIEKPIQDSGYYGGTPIAYKLDLFNEALTKAREALLKQAAEAKAAADLKAKQDAEAKAAADLKAKQDAEAKVVTPKKITITCVKGKVIKKVTALKPVCPSGYKKS